MHSTQPSIAALGGCVALALALWLAGAQAELVDATLVASSEKQPLLEKYDPEVKVSGNVVVGVMIASAYNGLSENQLAISPGETLQESKVCLQITSRDGAYTSRNNYTVALANSEDSVKLPYESQYPNILAEYKEEGGLAVTATSGSCKQSGRDTYYLPHLWETQDLQRTSKPWSASIYINGFEATDVYYTFEKGKGEPRDCTYIEEGRHTVFNFICEVHVADIPKKVGSPLKLNILREVYGRELEPITIKVLAVR